MRKKIDVYQRLNSYSLQCKNIVMRLYIFKSYNIKLLTAQIPLFFLQQSGMMRQTTRRKQKYIARSLRYTNYRSRNCVSSRIDWNGSKR